MAAQTTSTKKKAKAPKAKATKATKAKAPKASTAKADARVADLEKQVKKLTKQLASVQAEREELLAKLVKQKSRVKKAVAKAKSAVGARSGKAVTFIEDHSPIEVPEVVEKAVGADRPDESWTVTRLRAEARAQSVAGYSRMSKQQLLAALA